MRHLLDVQHERQRRNDFAHRSILPQHLALYTNF